MGLGPFGGHHLGDDFVPTFEGFPIAFFEDGFKGIPQKDDV